MRATLGKKTLLSTNYIISRIYNFSNVYISTFNLNFLFVRKIIFTCNKRIYNLNLFHTRRSTCSYDIGMQINTESTLERRMFFVNSQTYWKLNLKNANLCACLVEKSVQVDLTTICIFPCVLWRRRAEKTITYRRVPGIIISVNVRVSQNVLQITGARLAG